MDLTHPVDTAGGVATAAPVTGRLRRVIAAVLDVDADALDDTASPDSVASWDSLNHLNVAMAIETEYQIAFTPEEVMEMRDVGHIRAALRAHGVEA